MNESGAHGASVRREEMVCGGLAAAGAVFHAAHLGFARHGGAPMTTEMLVVAAVVSLSVGLLAKAFPGRDKPGRALAITRGCALLALAIALWLTWQGLNNPSGPGWVIDDDGVRRLVAARAGLVAGVLLSWLAVAFLMPLRRPWPTLLAGCAALFVGMSALYVVAGHVHAAWSPIGLRVQFATSWSIGLSMAALATGILIAMPRSASLLGGWRLRAILIAALCLPMLATWHLWQRAVVTADEAARSDFHGRAETIEKQIVGEMGEHERTLIDAAAMLAIAPHMDQSIWRTYVDGLLMHATMPGVRGIGVAQIVQTGQEAALIDTMRAQGAKGFTVWPATAEKQRVAVVFLEPADQVNRMAMGYDMMSERLRRTALTCASRQERPCATARLTLIQDTRFGDQPGFLVYMAVRRPSPAGDAHAHVPPEKFAYMAFRSRDLLGALQPSLDPRVHVRVHDGTAPLDEALMYDSLAKAGEAKPAPKAAYAFTSTIPVMGRPWTLAFSSTATFDAVAMRALPNASRYGFAVILLQSLAFAILLAVDRSAALQRSQQHSQHLEEMNARYEAQNQLLTQSHAQAKAQQQRIAEALEEKETLLREVYHRVKNNLQVIQSLLNLQRRSLPEGSTASAIEDTVRRVKAMSLVHEKLYQSGNLAAVSLRDYTEDLVKHFAEAGGVRQRHIQVHNEVAPVMTGLDHAVPFGLLLNELVSNCFKHAFPDDKGGDVWITLTRKEEGIELTVADNGVGLPESFSLEGGQSMGLKLVVSLARQLGAKVEVERGERTTFRALITRW